MSPRRAKNAPAVPGPAPAASPAAAPARLERLAQAAPPPGDPRGAAACLRAVLEQKVTRMAAAGEVDREQADELAKIGQALSRLEKAGFDLKAAAAEVLARFAGFVLTRGGPPARLSWLADNLEAFFQRLDEEA